MVARISAVCSMSCVACHARVMAASAERPRIGLKSIISSTMVAIVIAIHIIDIKPGMSVVAVTDSQPEEINPDSISAIIVGGSSIDIIIVFRIQVKLPSSGST